MGNDEAKLAMKLRAKSDMDHTAFVGTARG